MSVKSKEHQQAVLAQLRGVGPQPASEIQACLGITKREVEHALWILMNQNKVDHDYPVTSPFIYKAVKEET